MMLESNSQEHGSYAEAFKHRPPMLQAEGDGSALVLVNTRYRTPKHLRGGSREETSPKQVWIVGQKKNSLSANTGTHPSGVKQAQKTRQRNEHEVRGA